MGEDAETASVLERVKGRQLLVWCDLRMRLKGWRRMCASRWPQARSSNRLNAHEQHMPCMVKARRKVGCPMPTCTLAAPAPAPPPAPAAVQYHNRHRPQPHQPQSMPQQYRLSSTMQQYQRSTSTSHLDAQHHEHQRHMARPNDGEERSDEHYGGHKAHSEGAVPGRHRLRKQEARSKKPRKGGRFNPSACCFKCSVVRV